MLNPSAHHIYLNYREIEVGIADTVSKDLIHVYIIKKRSFPSDFPIAIFAIRK